MSDINKRIEDIERKLRANKLRVLQGLMDGLGEADLCEIVSGGRCFSLVELEKYDQTLCEFIKNELQGRG